MKFNGSFGDSHDLPDFPGAFSFCGPFQCFNLPFGQVTQEIPGFFFTGFDTLQGFMDMWLDQVEDKRPVIRNFLVSRIQRQDRFRTGPVLEMT